MNTVSFEDFVQLAKRMAPRHTDLITFSNNNTVTYYGYVTHSQCGWTRQHLWVLHDEHNREPSVYSSISDILKSEPDVVHFEPLTKIAAEELST